MASLHKTPLVSVVMPMRNSETTIRLAVESVLGQTYENLELLVVDDCSEDGSSKIVERFRDPRIHLLRHSLVRGPGAARNTAICQASGSWLAFIDADDMWKKERLECLLQVASDYEDVMVCDGVSVCVGNRDVLKPLYSYWSSNDLGLIRESALFDLQRFLGLSRWTVQPMIPLGIVRHHGLLQPERDYAEDIEFLLRLLNKGVPLVIIETEMYLYRRGHVSASRNPQRAAILRRTLENLEGELELTVAERDALRGRIAGLELQEDYLRFAGGLKRGRLLYTMNVLGKNPRVLSELLRRMPGTLNVRRHQLVDKFRAWKK